jgi:hypothetical protein
MFPPPTAPVACTAVKLIRKWVVEDPDDGVTDTCTLGELIGIAAPEVPGIATIPKSAITAAALRLISRASLPARLQPSYI